MQAKEGEKGREAAGCRGRGEERTEGNGEREGGRKICGGSMKEGKRRGEKDGEIRRVEEMVV